MQARSALLHSLNKCESTRPKCLPSDPRNLVQYVPLKASLKACRKASHVAFIALMDVPPRYTIPSLTLIVTHPTILLPVNYEETMLKSMEYLRSRWNHEKVLLLLWIYCFRYCSS
jgi:hypothetical protein